MSQDLINHVNAAIEAAERGLSSLPKEALYVNGMSSDMSRHLMNNLAKGRRKYLEIGTWRGSTLIAATAGNQLELSVGVDNFSQFTLPSPHGMMLWCNHGTPEHEKPKWQTDMHPKDELFRNLHYFGLGNIQIFDADCFHQDIITVLDGLGPFDFFFNDGDHKFACQKQTIVDYAKLLADEAIVAVDDWNAGEVREGTLAGFKETNLKIHKQVDLFTRGNCDLSSWWNGIGIFVVSK